MCSIEHPSPTEGKRSHLELAVPVLVCRDDVLEEVRLPSDGITRLGVLERRRRQDEVPLGPVLDLRTSGKKREAVSASRGANGRAAKSLATRLWPLVT